MSLDGGHGPQAVVTAENHQAYIIITAILGLLWTLLVFAIRMYLRLWLNGPFGWDDAAATFATVRAWANQVIAMI